MRLPSLAALMLVLASSPLAAFELQRMDGERTNVNDYVGDGRWTVVMMWSTDCVKCEVQKPMLEQFHERHADTNAHVIGIALDGPGSMPEIEAMVDLHAAPYPTLVAFDDVYREQFRDLAGRPYRGTPTYLLYSPDGRFRGAHTGPIKQEVLESVIASGG